MPRAVQHAYLMGPGQSVHAAAPTRSTAKQAWASNKCSGAAVQPGVLPSGHPPAASAPAPAPAAAAASAAAASSASLPAPSASASRMAPASAPALQLLGAPSCWMARAAATAASCCCSTRLLASLGARASASNACPAVKRHTPLWVSSCCSAGRANSCARSSRALQRLCCWCISVTDEGTGAAAPAAASSAGSAGPQLPSCQVCQLQLPVMDAEAMAGTSWFTMPATSTSPGLCVPASGRGSSSSTLLASAAAAARGEACWWLPAVYTAKHTISALDVTQDACGTAVAQHQTVQQQYSARTQTLAKSTVQHFVRGAFSAQHAYAAACSQRPAIMLQSGSTACQAARPVT
jgi:hypothetical protein